MGASLTTCVAEEKSLEVKSPSNKTGAKEPQEKKMVCSWQDSYGVCKKNPGHKNFLPVPYFLTDPSPLLASYHLTEEQTQEITEVVGILSKITANVTSISRNSVDRPKKFPGTDCPYPFFSHVGKTNRQSSGYLASRLIRQDGQCPCCDCKSSDSEGESQRQNKYWLCLVSTTTQTVFDTTEAEFTTFTFFDIKRGLNDFHENRCDFERGLNTKLVRDLAVAADRIMKKREMALIGTAITVNDFMSRAGAEQSHTKYGSGRSVEHSGDNDASNGVKFVSSDTDTESLVSDGIITNNCHASLKSDDAKAQSHGTNTLSGAGNDFSERREKSNDDTSNRERYKGDDIMYQLKNQYDSQIAGDQNAVVCVTHCEETAKKLTKAWESLIRYRYKHRHSLDDILGHCQPLVSFPHAGSMMVSVGRRSENTILSLGEVIKLEEYFRHGSRFAEYKYEVISDTGNRLIPTGCELETPHGLWNENLLVDTDLVRIPVRTKVEIWPQGWEGFDFCSFSYSLRKTIGIPLDSLRIPNRHACSTYYYDTATCPGSAGAFVWNPNLWWGISTHSGSIGDSNKSGILLNW